MNKKLIQAEDLENLSLEQIKNLYKSYVSPSLTDILDSFSTGDLQIESASGVWLHTKQGERILDVTGGSGVLNLGHNPDIVLQARIQYQQRKKMEIHKNFFSAELAALSHNMEAMTPGDLTYSYFCNSGAEAIDASLKQAYKYHNGKRSLVLHTDIGFHGKLISTTQITQPLEKKFQFQKLLKADYFRYDDFFHLKEIVRGRESDIYAIIIEPFSASHLKFWSQSNLEKLRNFCDEYDIVLIFDEVYTGWHKTGPLFSFMEYEIIPDILTTSKSLGGGKASISASVSSKKIFLKTFKKTKEALLTSTTYNGFGEESLTALVATNELFSNNYQSRAKNIETYIKKKSQILQEKFPQVIDCTRGRGSLHGFYFKSLPISGFNLLPDSIRNSLDSSLLKKIIVASVADDLLSSHKVFTSFMNNSHPYLGLAPSLIIQNEELDIFFNSMEKTLSMGISSLINKFIGKKLSKVLA